MFNCVLLIASLISCYPAGDGQDTKNPSQDEEETTSSVDLPESLLPGTDVTIGNFDSDVTQQEEDSSPDESPITWTDCDQWPGSHPCDFTLVDQHGSDWSLYDYYGTVVVIDFSTMWCSVCNNIAHDAQVFMDDYGSQDFVWVTVLIDDSQGDPPTLDNVVDWCDIYGIDDAYVLAGDRSFVDQTAETGYPISAWPTIVVIDREMVLKHGLVGWNETTVRAYVESLL